MGRCGSGPLLSPILPLRLAEKKASIGYTYEDSTVAELENAAEKRGDDEESEEESNTDEDEVIPDSDMEVDVDELNQEQVADLNKQVTTYGMAEGDFVRMLRKDKEEAEAIKNAKALEEEKAMYSVSGCAPPRGAVGQLGVAAPRLGGPTGGGVSNQGKNVEMAPKLV
ncbi:CLK4-associating serine/arginine rich protein-like [Tympanuchus pallidicinctus]|uniref:CLK4-associating serine/arginine rich protein-like n=1 Tax=Tympanuchus pallidicinctus TaxID=109042 RepID=UPI002286D7D0|nr:CLK4-associating serine/arginine rich protein-like [Tympanuchus pallidicinctus]